MSILGTIVVHKKWGKGTIIDKKGDIISVQFQTPTDEDKIILFQFPEAFYKGFLAAADSESSIHISSSIEDLKCSVCGQSHIHTELIDGNRYCSSCKRENTTPCEICGKPHTKDNLIIAKGQYPLLHEFFICKDCSTEHSYVCQNCRHTYLHKEKPAKKLNNHIFCNECSQFIVKSCHFCKKEFLLSDGKQIPTFKDIMYICPDCLPRHFFTCTICKNLRPINSLVNSKFVPSTKSVCNHCISECSKCGVKIEKQHAHSSFKKFFCPDCWNSYMLKCPYCGNEFIPELSTQEICPDCLETQAYISLLKNSEFLKQAYLAYDYYSLDHIDRCTLFTRLHENRLLFEYCESSNFLTAHADTLYQFLIINMLGYRMVITYLPPSIFKNIKYSKNITMTEFLSKKERFAVHATIHKWEELSTQSVETSAGTMKILNSPILCRVQLKSNKEYGKNWNGRNGYTVIGNYGDTTDFYIIGIL